MVKAAAWSSSSCAVALWRLGVGSAVATRSLAQCNRSVLPSVQPNPEQAIGMQCREGLLGLIGAVSWTQWAVPNGSSSPNLGAYTREIA